MARGGIGVVGNNVGSEPIERHGSWLVKEGIYYSAWYWSALHILTSIDAYHRPEKMAERLNLPISVVADCLAQLEQMGLVKKSHRGWRNVSGGLHLPSNSVLAGNHHGNWRQRAVMDSYQPRNGSLHFTEVHSLSLDDFQEIREQLLQVLDRARALVKRSPEQERACLCLDYFSV